MKKAIKVLLVSLVAVSLLSACGKAPVDKVNAAKGAVDAVVSEGAEQYTPEELAKLIKKLDEALVEVKAQDETFFKNYTTAEFYLGKVVEDGELLKAKIAKRKDELKAAAGTALEQAQAALAEARALLEVAPQGKGSLADIEAMKGDVAGLETELANVQPQIDAGEYIAANEKALAVAATAMTISSDIKAAQEKLAALPQQ